MAKVLISIDETLLRRMDQSAKSAGLTRSAYVALLAERDSARENARADRAMHDAFDTLDILFAKAPPGDSTEEIRAMRDSR